VTNPRDLSDFSDAERERLGALAGRLDSLGTDAWDLPTPPPLRSLPTEAATPRARRGVVLRPGFAVAACAGMLAVGLGAGIVIERAGRTETPVVAARTQSLARVGAAPAAAGGTLRITNEETPRVTVDVHDVAPTGSGRFYEVWLLNSADDLVSVGGFRVDGTGAGHFEGSLPIPASNFKYIDVSLEPTDGNPAHSKDSVLQTEL
jgi:anti-sigma-K factor RskA